MAGKPGEIIEGELWQRCPYCGDSDKSPWKAHFSINLSSGKYFCLRCRQGGRLTTKQLLDLSLHGVDLETFRGVEIEKALPTLFPGPASTRSSLLSRHKLDDPEGAWDAFYMYDLQEEDPIGVMLRRGKSSFMHGDAGYNWPGAPYPLTSLPEMPIRVVEGPWDVQAARDIAVMGIIDKSALHDLRHHYLVLCPDGDIWTKSDLRDNFLRLLVYAMSRYLIIGIEMLPEGKDPDEVKPWEREFISRDQVRRSLL